MNEKIDLQLKNVYLYCLQQINSSLELDNENFIENSFINVIIKAHYLFLDSEIRENYSLDDFKSDLLKLFEKVKPAKAIAEDRLEPWLAISQRNNPELRFESYKRYLANDNKIELIPQLDADTFYILDKCHNPKELGYEWDRRGLVYGNVQSGKTANYIGLINRAFDSGYQIVIVFTGMTEDLRSQTQRRIDEGVVGQRGQYKLGIGEETIFQAITETIKPATTLFDDLSKKNSDILGSLISTNEKSIWVIKKNKTVLENLILWLDKQRSNDSYGKIDKVPFLVIDDEADNASIQSLSKKDFEIWGEGQKLSELDMEDLTEEQNLELKKAQDRIIQAINRNIRVALSLMSHKTFVAYTATPYSIINQSEKEVEKSVVIGGKTFAIDADSDLFPRHFIIPISAGSNYLGVENIFNEKFEKRLPVLVNLTEKFNSEKLELLFPCQKGEKYSFLRIPQSLQDAILHFIVTIVIRKHRGHNDYNTLMVHTSHLTENADYVAFEIEKFIKELREKLPGDFGGYFKRILEKFEEIKANSHNSIFKHYFNREYEFPEEITIQNILDVIESKMDDDYNYIYAPFDVVSYHSSKNDGLRHKSRVLDYNLRDEKGHKKFKNYIVVGGNRLSRGLTLAGLSTSYFVRNSTRQDSLYQMARWFGYRIGYEDLVRIYMPSDQILWFEGVYKLEAELRRDFIENNENDEDSLLPKDAVIKMAVYTPENMYTSEDVRKKFPAICDPNKLRNTRLQSLTKSGTTKTNRIVQDSVVQQSNINAVKHLLESISSDTKARLFDPRESKVPDIKNNSNCNYTNVYFEHILNFLTNYLADDIIRQELDLLKNFITKNSGELEFWSFSLVNRGDKVVPDIKANIYSDGDYKPNADIHYVRRDKSAQSDGETLIFRSILDQQKDNIFDVIDESNEMEYSTGNKSEIVKKYRNKLKKPLLLIYLSASDKAPDIPVFPLLYFFVPVLDKAEKVTYILRKKPL